MDAVINTAMNFLQVRSCLTTCLGVGICSLPMLYILQDGFIDTFDGSTASALF